MTRRSHRLAQFGEHIHHLSDLLFRMPGARCESDPSRPDGDRWVTNTLGVDPLLQCTVGKCHGSLAIANDRGNDMGRAESCFVAGTVKAGSEKVGPLAKSIDPVGFALDDSERLARRPQCGRGDGTGKDEASSTVDKKVLDLCGATNKCAEASE